MLLHHKWVCDLVASVMSMRSSYGINPSVTDHYAAADVRKLTVACFVVILIVYWGY